MSFYSDTNYLETEKACLLLLVTLLSGEYRHPLTPPDGEL